MSRFVKGQWYQSKATKRYFQCVCSDTGCVRMRQAGSLVHYNIDLFNSNMLIPASLIPDFSNAKVGESCFDVELEHCKISEVREYDVYTMLMVDDDKGNLNPHIIYKDGYAHNPLLFNSFAQFKAYWAEQALLMATQRSKS